jgi:serine/threonine-protein kinase
MTRILLADDDSAITETLVFFLQAEHDVDVVDNGAAAYDKLASNGFGIAILDWDMPQMTGPEICKKYRAIGGQTPIIMLTGRASDEEKEVGFDVGADDYLTKPFSLKELAARIRNLIKRSATASTATPFNSSVDLLNRVRVCVSCGNQYDAADPVSESCPTDGAPTVLVSVEQLLGKIVCGSYTIESLLGVGAWSEVYKAKIGNTGEPVAVKILHAHLACDPLKVVRFNREAEALVRLQHRCLARVHEQGTLNDGRPCLIMEYLDGISLEKFLSVNGRMTVEQAKPFYVLLSEGLASAHDQGLIHRDLKPSNVYLVTEDGIVTPKILDFGLAKILTAEGASALASLTQSGEVLGSPAYMSPEQCLGQPIDARSDLYSLGCLVYESLTGTRAIPGRTAFEAMSNQLARFPDPMNEICPQSCVSPMIEDIVFKLLAKDPDDRFDNAREFVLALRNAV